MPPRLASPSETWMPDLVVAVVLEPGGAAERGVDRRRRVAALGDDPGGSVCGLRVVGARVEEPRGVERVTLRVQRVARVLDEHDPVAIPERHVVEGRVDGVAEEEDRRRAVETGRSLT
jgi:hypothetical protein